MFCGVCHYALANKVAHPLNVYLPERDVLPPLDEWLMLAFAPHRLTESIEAMYDAQPADDRNRAQLQAT